MKYGGQIYDPSYGGGPFGSELNHENAAVDGFVDTNSHAKRNGAPQELDYTP